MKVTADSKKRVVLPGARPGDLFAVRVFGDEFHLTRLRPAPRQDSAHLVERDGLLLAAGTRPVTQAQVRTALDEFP